MNAIAMLRSKTSELLETENAVVVENVSKKFRIPREKKTTVYDHIVGLIKGGKYSYEEFLALKNVSFTVKKGETLGVIGENGSGKSTLLKIIARVLRPDQGWVKVNGKVASFLELGVGFHPELTAKENIFMYSAIMGIPQNKIKARLEEIFEFAELEYFKDMKLKNFSSGMYMRLAFSTAIATDPDIFLIDEVLAVGDEAFQRKCFNKFEEFKAQGKTIILVSHALDTVKKMCKEAILLNQGEIIARGSSGDVVELYLSKFRAV